MQLQHEVVGICCISNEARASLRSNAKEIVHSKHVAFAKCIRSFKYEQEGKMNAPYLVVL